jgi:DNA-binding SARP family transcriptional activator
MSEHATLFQEPVGELASAQPILRLRTFGGMGIEQTSGRFDASIAQRRKLALLTLLAASRDGITRDRIVGLLWSECDEGRARHTLSQLVHALRRAVHERVIVGSGMSLRLDAAIVSSDLADFEAAIAREDYAEAVRLYRGSFLDGFYLNGCPEFERWVEDRRAVLARQAEKAIETLATRAGASGDARQAAEWWLNLSALRPLDSRITLGLMQATVAAGDHGTALSYARAHERLLRSELDVAPAPALTAYAASLRTATWSTHAGVGVGAGAGLRTA